MKVSVCVIFPEGESLRDWRESLPEENIEIVAIETSINPNGEEPKPTEVKLRRGRGARDVGL